MGVTTQQRLRLIVTLGTMLLSNSAPAQEASHISPQEIVERAKQTRAIQELLEVYPEADAQVHFNRKHGCWIVEFLVEGREVGFASVSEDGQAVLEADFQGERGEQKERPSLLRVLRPTFEGGSLFWLAGLVVVLVLLDFDRPISWWNVDVLSLLALAPFLLLLWTRMQLAYAGIYVITVYLFGRVLYAARWPRALLVPANLKARPLAVVLALAFLFHLYVIKLRGTEDSGIWGSFGAQHLLGHGQMPYGQQHFGGGDTYGPLFYAVHVPFVLLWQPGYYSEDGFQPLVEGLPEDVPFERLVFTGAQVSAALFDALVLAGLVLLGCRWRGAELGLSLALVYAVLPYTISGLIHPSHIVGTACTVWALVYLSRPIISGLLLALGVGTLLYPIFLLPLWVSYYFGRERFRFVLSVTVVGLVCLLVVNVGESNLHAFFANTWSQQEGADRGGGSEFGYWGQHPGLSFLKPVVSVAYLLFCLALFLWPRHKTESSLIALSAAVLIGTQLWKTHGGGTYIEWYLPWLLMTFVGEPTGPRDGARAAGT